MERATRGEMVIEYSSKVVHMAFSNKQEGGRVVGAAAPYAFKRTSWPTRQNAGTFVACRVHAWHRVLPTLAYMRQIIERDEIHYLTATLGAGYLK